MIAELRGQTFNPNRPLTYLDAPESTPFAANSRYLNLATRTHTLPSGRVVAYVERRFAPDPAQFSDARVHLVVQGDRLDLLAYRYLGDAELSWRLADANSALHPAEVVSHPGQALRITLPSDAPGSGLAP